MSEVVGGAMKKKLPTLGIDAQTETFAADSDPTEYDLSVLGPMGFELKPMDNSLRLPPPDPLPETVRERAATENVPYQRVRRILFVGAQLRGKACNAGRRFRFNA